MSELCVVCRKRCGSLSGRAKSWACAGRLAHSSRLANAISKTMKTDVKSVVRDLVIAYCGVFAARGVILDLWGGGESARRLTNAFPNNRIVSAEENKRLWPRLRTDAMQHGYEAHLGPVSTVSEPREIGFAWLDYCGFFSQAKWDDLRRLRRQQCPIALTVMGSRDSLKGVRPFALPWTVMLASGKQLDVAFRYRRESRGYMYFFLLNDSLSWLNHRLGLESVMFELAGISQAFLDNKIWVRDSGEGSRLLRKAIPPTLADIFQGTSGDGSADGWRADELEGFLAV